MKQAFLVYGANGYTGALIARQAVTLGLTPILAGRRTEAVEPLARELHLEHRTASLDDPAALDRALQGVACVLHCAGPFIRTARPMIDACLRQRVHYLDITGEIDVFEQAAARDAEAKIAGVMVMPGAGFDVVPTDCLALHLKRRLPTATKLALGLKTGGRPSHGTSTTMVENVASGGRVRRNGLVTVVPQGHRTLAIDFGHGAESAIALPWGDVATAFYSTGIPDIEVFVALPAPVRLGLRSTEWLGGLLGSAPAQRLLKALIPVGGPSAQEREAGRCRLWGEVRDDAGQTRASRMTTPDGYVLTVGAALFIARRVLRGDAPPGYQTPAKAYGPDFVLELDGVSRTDL